MNKEPESIQQKVEMIIERNKRVEADKAWETSGLRKILIAVITYVLIGLYMTYLEVKEPWLNALVPTVGYLLSTLTLAWVKEIWISRKGL